MSESAKTGPTRQVVIWVTTTIAVLICILALVSPVRRILFQRMVVSSDSRSNQELIFFGLVCDQDGLPIAGALISGTMTVFSSTNWTGNPDKRASDEPFNTQTGSDGRFALPVRAQFLRITAINVGNEYTWVRSNDAGFGDRQIGWPYNHGYSLGELGGKTIYRTREDKPAVFVMLKKGSGNVVHVKMSRGGEDLFSYWYINEPFWPRTTVPPGVTYEPPTTGPS